MAEGDYTGTEYTILKSNTTTDSFASISGEETFDCTNHTVNILGGKEGQKKISNIRFSDILFTESQELPPSHKPLIAASNAFRIYFNNVTFQGSLRSCLKLIGECWDITFMNCRFLQCGNEGKPVIDLEVDNIESDEQINSIDIFHCHFENCYGPAIRIGRQTRNIRIGYNKFHGLSNTLLSSGIRKGKRGVLDTALNMIEIRNAADVWIHGNRFAHTNGYSVYAENTRGVRIEGNAFEGSFLPMIKDSRAFSFSYNSINWSKQGKENFSNLKYEGCTSISIQGNLV